MASIPALYHVLLLPSNAALLRGRSRACKERKGRHLLSKWGQQRSKATPGSPAESLKPPPRTRNEPRAESRASRNGPPRPKAARKWNWGSPCTRWVEPDRGFAWCTAPDRPGSVGSWGG